MLKRLIIVVAALGLLTGMAGLWLLWLSPGPKPGPHRVTIGEGASLASVSRQLEQQGVIPGTAMTFRGMAKLLGSSDPVQAGEFEIPAGSSGAEVLDILQHGRPVVRLVTIPEGMPSILVQEKLAAIRELTGAAPLPEEGSVLPNSYDWQAGEARAAVLKRMTDAMDKELARLQLGQAGRVRGRLAEQLRGGDQVADQRFGVVRGNHPSGERGIGQILAIGVSLWVGQVGRAA